MDRPSPSRGVPAPAARSQADNTIGSSSAASATVRMDADLRKQCKTPRRGGSKNQSHADIIKAAPLSEALHRKALGLALRSGAGRNHAGVGIEAPVPLRSAKASAHRA